MLVLLYLISRHLIISVLKLASVRQLTYIAQYHLKDSTHNTSLLQESYYITIQVFH